MQAMPTHPVDSQAKRRAVVVGGGVVGCATAYRLARGGFAVTLIEQDAIGAHASGKNAGNLNPLHATPAALLPDALASFHRHAEIRAELAELGYTGSPARPVKRVHLAYSEVDRPHLQEISARCDATDGFSSTWLDRDDLRRMEPRLAPDLESGLLTTGGLSIDSHGFTSSLAAAAVQLGTVIVTTTVTGIQSAGDRVTAVTTTAGPVPCDDLVFATGPWVSEINSWLGIGIAIEPVRGELLLVQLRGAALRYDFTWGSACLYLRRDNEVWIGGTMACSGFDAAPTFEAGKFLLDQAAHIMPEIRQATLLDHVAALRPMLAHEAPVACRANGWQNVYIANGGGAKGVLLSAGIADRILHLLLGSESNLTLETPQT